MKAWGNAMTRDERIQQLLDKAGARPAGGRGLGVGADIAERCQAFACDRAGDRALAHAVAAAHLGAICHRHGAVLAAVAGVSQVVFAEDQRIGDGCHGGGGDGGGGGIRLSYMHTHSFSLV